MPGPPQKPADLRARTNPTPGFLQLPAVGRKGKPPKWPLRDDVVMQARYEHLQSKVAAMQDKILRQQMADEPDQFKISELEEKLDRLQEDEHILAAQLNAQRELEQEIWRGLWFTPQAVAWTHMGWYREVAQYVRHRVLGELGFMPDAVEARNWSDRLGLSPKAMQGLRWEILVDEIKPAEKPAARPTTAAPAGADPRSTLRAVN